MSFFEKQVVLRISRLTLVLNQVFIPSIALVNAFPIRCFWAGKTALNASQLSVKNQSMSKHFNFIISRLTVSAFLFPMAKASISSSFGAYAYSIHTFFSFLPTYDHCSSICT